MWIRATLVAATWWVASAAVAEPLLVAVASNFSTTAQTLARLFEESTGHRVDLVPGSTGKHYAQIVNGAPFDLFLAADTDHPERLEDRRIGVAGSRFTYAYGILVLWSADGALVDPAGRVLDRDEFRHLGIANHVLAPYGSAARQVLQELGLWSRLQNRIVQGENVGQAFQFVASGAAELGFVSLSQVRHAAEAADRGSVWQVPAELYKPIEQQAVLLSDRPVAREFLEFLQSAEARELIRRHGYRVPGEPGS